MIFDIDAQIILGDSIDLSPFVVSYTRTHSMCNVSHIGEVRLSPNVYDFLEANEIDIQIYEPIHIIEYNKTVLTGYVARVVHARSPASLVTVFFSDTYKRAKDYFIEDPNWVTANESLGSVFGQLCELCGLSYVVDDETGGVLLPPGETIGLGTVDAALQKLVAYATGVIYTDGSGVVHLRHGAKSSDLRFTTGETLPKVDYAGSGWTNVTLPEDITQGNVFQGTVVDSDENTRDVVSVWGYAPYNKYQPNADLRLVATESVDLGLPVPKTMVYVSSLIQTQAEADRLARVMIADLGQLDEVVTLECQGNPYISILKSAEIDINLEMAQFTDTKRITTVATSVSAEGYTMIVTFDEFCPKFAGWSVATLPTIVYAGTVRHGVFKSMDLGITWSGYNNGLTTGNKYVTSMGTTDMDEVMAIINGVVWYVTSSGLTIENPLWVRKYPLVGLSSVSGITADHISHMRYVNVTSAGQSPGQFNVLATSTRIETLVSGAITYTIPESRAVVCSTTDAGRTWDHTLIHDGDDCDFSGINMSSRFSTPYVITTKMAVQLPAMIPVRVEKQMFRRAFLWQYWIPPGMTFPNYYVTGEVPPERYGVLDFELYTNWNNLNLFGILGPGATPTPNRTIAFPIYAVMDAPMVGYYIPPENWEGGGFPPTAIPQLYSVQCYYQYSTYNNPEFTTLLTWDVEDMWGVWEFQNKASVIGLGNINQPYPVYDKAWGNVDMTKLRQEFILAKEYGVDNYRLWGDGFRGSVGLCFSANYRIGNDDDPGHPFLLTVLTGSNPRIWTANWDCNFLAGTLYWDFSQEDIA